MTKGKVLIVEDDAKIADIVLFHLKKLGYDVESAEDGAEGLDRVARETYDCVVTDLSMPRLGGVDFIRIARQRNPHLAVVVISANPTAENVLATLDLGAYRFLKKPFQLTELARVVEKAMEREADATTTIEESEGWIEIVASSDFENAERLENFITLLAASAIDPKEVETLGTALRQLLANAIEWGNHFDPSKRIRVALRIDPDRVHVKVKDEGTGFNVKAIDRKFDDAAQMTLQRLKAGKRAGGFGIQLVRELMDDLRYNPAGNEVVMTKFIRK